MCICQQSLLFLLILRRLAKRDVSKDEGPDDVTILGWRPYLLRRTRT
jgi:hypothetical protein